MNNINTHKVNSKVVVALDFSNQTALFNVIDRLSPDQCRLKIGKELFVRFGPAMVTKLHSEGFEVFLDLKFHDIPNTVAKAVTAAADLGVWMVNIHASGGSKMMQAAADALKPYGDKKPLLIAVTVLTSMSNEDLALLQLPKAEILVPRLAKLAVDNGMDGVVCSAQEVSSIKQVCGKQFLAVTPGIRPAGTSLDDQCRVLTPKQAVDQGADYLVIGRPITKSEQPLDVLRKINQELAE